MSSVRRARRTSGFHNWALGALPRPLVGEGTARRVGDSLSVQDRSQESVPPRSHDHGTRSHVNLVVHVARAPNLPGPADRSNPGSVALWWAPPRRVLPAFPPSFDLRLI